MNKTAIFVDGAFFIKRAYAIFGPLEPKELADKLWTYSLYIFIHIEAIRTLENFVTKTSIMLWSIFIEYSFMIVRLYKRKCTIL